MTLVAQSLADVTRHFKAGRNAEAEATCRRILASDPENPEALHLLGVIATETQKYDVAIAFIRKAIALDGETGFLPCKPWPGLPVSLAA